MSNKHSRFSPSSSSVWLNCPKSIHIIEGLPKADQDTSSEAAIEGTGYHDLMEKFVLDHDLSYFIHPKINYTDFLKKSGFTRSIMSANLFNIMVELCHLINDAPVPGKKPKVYVEQRVKMDSVIKGCFGTADLIIKKGTTLFVCDYKFGRIQVSPDSSQLILYAIGALDKYDKKGEIKKVVNVIIQPRVNASYHKIEYKRTGIEMFRKRYEKQAKRILAKKPKAVVGTHCKAYVPCRKYCEVYRTNLVEDTKKYFEGVNV